MTVEEADAPEQEMLYSNLDDENLPWDGCKDLAYFEDKLREMNIDVPAEMFENVRQDCMNNTGNREVSYN